MASTIKLTFEGDTLADIVAQCRNFAGAEEPPDKGTAPVDLNSAVAWVNENYAGPMGFQVVIVEPIVPPAPPTPTGDPQVDTVTLGGANATTAQLGSKRARTRKAAAPATRQDETGDAEGSDAEALEPTDPFDLAPKPPAKVNGAESWSAAELRGNIATVARRIYDLSDEHQTMVTELVKAQGAPTIKALPDDKLLPLWHAVAALAAKHGQSAAP